MKKIICGLVVLLGVVSAVGVKYVRAQAGLAVGMGLGAATGGRWYQPYGWGYGGGTVAEGYGRGMADVIRAQGQYNQAAAEAQLTREEARSRAIENNKKAADTYWAMKENYRKEQEQKRQRLRRRSSANRAKLESAPRSTPQRGLGPDDFDPVTGRIDWPATLQTDNFAKYRKQLDELFEHRTLTGGAAGQDNSEAIKSATTAMRNELKRHITEIPSMEYMAARKFIDGLAYEGRS